MSYAMQGLGLSVYYPPGTIQNPAPPPPPPPPPPAPPPPPPKQPETPVPNTLAVVQPTGWWSTQSPTVRYAILGGAAFLVLGAVVGVASK